MIPAGSTFHATITGTFGGFGAMFADDSLSIAAAFAGIGADSRIGAQLAGAGIVVEVFDISVPNLFDQVLELDVFSRPYQVSLTAHTTIDYTALADIQSQLALAFASALYVFPTSTSIDQLSGASTGQGTQPPLQFPTDRIPQALAGLSQFSTTTLVILGAVILGAIFIVGYGPNTGRVLDAARR